MAASVAVESMEAEQDLPGFRFHPTEEELLDFYLSRVAHGKKLHFDIIGTLNNIYRHDPCELPGMAKIGEREWYFFVPRDRKSGGRPNRTPERGFWKATGSDRPIRSSGDPKRMIGLKKALVFYQGRAPRGTKTDWVMNEYRLPDHAAAAPPKEDMVLCKIYRKATPLKELEQRASAMDEMQRYNNPGYAARASAGGDCLSSDGVKESFMVPSLSSSSTPSGDIQSDAPKEAQKETVTMASTTSLPQVSSQPSLHLPSANQVLFDLPSLQIPAASHGVLDLPSLQIPVASCTGFDWMQDPFLTQLRSPWLQDQHCLSPYAHLLYY